MSSVGIDRDQPDLTRKQRREQAREQRKALEQAQAAAAVKRRRLTILGLLSAFVVAGIVVVLIASAGEGSDHRVAAGSGGAEQVTRQVSSLLAGIPQSGNVLGDPNAPVTLQYFGDLECPVCRAFTVEALPEIVQRWVRSGTLRIEYHSLETATREPETFKTQQVAALAAGKQNRMWNFIETFYHEQGEEDTGYVTEAFIQGIARQVPGLDLAGWSSERAQGALLAQVEADAQTANSRDLTGTPAFLIGRTNGTLKQLEPSSFTDSSSFDEAIEKLSHS